MSKSASLDEAWEALAEAEGLTVEQLQARLLGERLRTHHAPAREEYDERPALPMPSQHGRSLAGPRPAMPLGRTARVEPEFPGDATARAGRSRSRDAYESPADAEERWLHEEAALDDGVHGFGGQTAGGIFGDAPIATSVYDPMAMQRSEGRAVLRLQGQQAQAIAQLTTAVGELVERLGPAASRAALPPAQTHRRLGRGNKR